MQAERLPLLVEVLADSSTLEPLFELVFRSDEVSLNFAWLDFLSALLSLRDQMIEDQMFSGCKAATNLAATLRLLSLRLFAELEKEVEGEAEAGKSAGLAALPRRLTLLQMLAACAAEPAGNNEPTFSAALFYERALQLSSKDLHNSYFLKLLDSLLAAPADAALPAQMLDPVLFLSFLERLLARVREVRAKPANRFRGPHAQLLRDLVSRIRRVAALSNPAFALVHAGSLDEVGEPSSPVPNYSLIATTINDNINTTATTTTSKFDVELETKAETNKESASQIDPQVAVVIKAPARRAGADFSTHLFTDERFLLVDSSLALFVELEASYSQPEVNALKAACPLRGRASHSPARCARCRLAEDYYLEELEEKNKDRFQELVVHKGVMEVGLKLHVELPGLKFCFEAGPEGPTSKSVNLAFGPGSGDDNGLAWGAEDEEELAFGATDEADAELEEA